MNNNPAYRQEWILDSLKANPTISYNDMFANYSQEFAISRKTFDKDWLKANSTFKSYQETINKAKLQESIKIEKQSVKKAILDKNQILEQLTEIALAKPKNIEGIVYVTTPNEKINAMKTIVDIQGYKAVTKTETELKFNKEVVITIGE